MMDWQSLLLIAAGAAGVPIVTLLFKLIDAQIAKVENPRLRNALDELSDSTEAAVEAALNTVVKTSKDSGEWNKDTAAKVKEGVVQSAIAGVSDTTKKQLNVNFRDEQLAERVGNLIEVKLTALKEKRATKKPARRRTTTRKKS